MLIMEHGIHVALNLESVDHIIHLVECPHLIIAIAATGTTVLCPFVL